MMDIAMPLVMESVSGRSVRKSEMVNLKGRAGRARANGMKTKKPKAAEFGIKPITNLPADTVVRSVEPAVRGEPLLAKEIRYLLACIQSNNADWWDWQTASQVVPIVTRRKLWKLMLNAERPGATAGGSEQVRPNAPHERPPK